jgi:hypothetical protein
VASYGKSCWSSSWPNGEEIVLASGSRRRYRLRDRNNWGPYASWWCRTADSVQKGGATICYWSGCRKRERKARTLPGCRQLRRHGSQCHPPTSALHSSGKPGLPPRKTTTGDPNQSRSQSLRGNQGRARQRRWWQQRGAVGRRRRLWILGGGQGRWAAAGNPSGLACGLCLSG